MQTVILPNGETAEFPDEMPRDAIEKAISSWSANQPAVPQKEAAAARQTTVPGGLGGITRAAADAAAFGFADELKAAGAATGDWLANKIGLPASPGGSWQDAYTHHLADERANLASVPLGERIAGGVLGSLLTGGPIVKGAIRSASAIPRTLRSGASSAGVGAAYGFGSGEGLSDRLGTLAGGAALGFGAGVAVPVAINAASAAFNALRPEVRATNKLAQALARDKLTPAKVQGDLRAMPGGTIADVGGQNTKGLARAAASVPGRSKDLASDFFEKRQMEAADRVIKATNDTFKAGNNYYDVIRDLMQKRAAAAAPLYEKAHDKPVLALSDRMTGILRDPVGKAALAKGIEIQRIEAAARGVKFDPTVYGVEFDAAGNAFIKMVPDSLGRLGPARVPNFRALDAVKQGLDDLLEAYRNNITNRLQLSQRGLAINEMRKAVIQELDAMNPDYAAARNAWAGPTAAKTAMERGRSFFRRDAEVTAEELKNMSDSEKEFFLQGVGRGIKDMVNAIPDGANVVRRLISTPAMRDKLQAAFPGKKQEFDKYMRLLKREATFNKTRNAVLSGSRTTPLSQEINDAGFTHIGGLVSDALSAARGQPSGFFQLGSRVAGPAINRYRAGVMESTRDALGAMLFSPDPAAQRAALAALNQSRLATQASANLLGGVTPALTVQEIQMLERLKGDHSSPYQKP